MPRIVLRHASGTLVSHFLELLVGAVLGTTAIDETDAQVLATVLSQTVARLNNIADVRTVKLGNSSQLCV